MVTRICDICGAKMVNEGDVRIKVKSKMFIISWLNREVGWEKIDVCANCINAIKNERRNMER